MLPAQSWRGRIGRPRTALLDCAYFSPVRCDGMAEAGEAGAARTAPTAEEGVPHSQETAPLVEPDLEDPVQPPPQKPEPEPEPEPMSEPEPEQPEAQPMSEAERMEARKEMAEWLRVNRLHRHAELIAQIAGPCAQTRVNALRLVASVDAKELVVLLGTLRRTT